MLMKYNGFLMMFTKIMGIDEFFSMMSFLIKCFRRALLIWKMWSFTKLARVMNFAVMFFLFAYLWWRVEARTLVFYDSIQRQNEDKKMPEFPDCFIHPTQHTTLTRFWKLTWFYKRTKMYKLKTIQIEISIQLFLK